MPKIIIDTISNMDKTTIPKPNLTIHLSITFLSKLKSHHYSEKLKTIKIIKILLILKLINIKGNFFERPR
jgi:hypothetical protein